MSSPSRLSSFSFSCPPARAYLLTTVVSAFLNPFDVRPALHGGDAVGKAMDALVVAGIPLKGDFDFAVLLGDLVVSHPLEQRFLGSVDMANEVDDAPRYWNRVTPGLPPGQLSVKRISRPALRKAYSCKRSSIVSARNSISSKTRRSARRSPTCRYGHWATGPPSSSLV